MCRLRQQLQQSASEFDGELPAKLRLVCVFCITGLLGFAQDLAPRAYIVTPIGSNAVIISYSHSDGAILLDPTVPIEDSSGWMNIEILSYYHSFAIMGRSANVTMSMPYALGHFQGTVLGAENHVVRSGLADGRIRIAVNLRGGPAMRINEFVAYRERVVIGTSLTIVVPVGQYDPGRIINPGNNRWAAKPEIGLSKRWNRWVLDGYGGAWFFSQNAAFFPGSSTRSQHPIGVGEGHLAYYIRRALWASIDSNFWAGGRTTIDGRPRHDFAKNSRVGATLSLPLNRHQSVKFSFSRGAYISVGWDYTTVSAGWQYSWLTKPE
jgi:hypothetical protein